MCTRFSLQESVSPVLCKFWWLYGGVNGDLLQEDLCHIHVCCTQSLYPCSRPLRTCTSAGDTQTLKSRSVSVSVGFTDVHVLFVRVSLAGRGLILNVISPLPLSCWGFFFALGHGVCFFGGMQHSPVNGCSAVSCDFGVLAGEDECMFFFCTILWSILNCIQSIPAQGRAGWSLTPTLPLPYKNFLPLTPSLPQPEHWKKTGRH